MKFVEKPNWPRDMKIAKKLWAQFPKFDFWEGWNPASKFPSLASFLTPYGQKLLNSQWKIHTLELSAPKSYILSKEKIGEDVEINKKPRSIMEFIKQD